MTKEFIYELLPTNTPFRGVCLAAIRRRNAITRRCATKLTKNAPHPKLIHLLGFYYDKITSIKKCKVQPTYDLSVPATNTYIANGFISHNTISFLMDCDTTGIEPELSLVKTKKLVGGGTIKQVNQSVPIGLQTLGYSEENIRLVLDDIKNGVVVKEPILQTALGEDALPWEAHIKMMAAAQPFISGGISKTINMPTESTVEDVQAAFRMAYDLGLKSVTVYRDGSKGSQPVTVAKTLEVPKPLTQRRRLPDTRESITHKFTIDTHSGYFTVGLYPDGTPGELFISVSKEGSTISGLLDSFGITVSLGLQYGIPLVAFIEKFKHARFEPQGFTKNPEIRMAKSIVDYIARWFELRFTTNHNVIVHDGIDGEELATLDTPLCDVCGSMMIRAGACHLCTICGATGGCS